MDTPNGPKTNTSNVQQEKDFLVYEGNHVPRIIRLVWTLIILFSVFYCVRYAWPDLKQWINKVK